MSTPYRRPPMQARRSQVQKKGLAVTSLVLGIVGIPTLGILFVGALVGLILGIVALVRANREPAVYGGRGIAIGGIITNSLCLVAAPIIGIIAAIAIPSLFRARVAANESQAIGDIRSVISAQAAYAASNGGFYDTLSCLASPSSCIPNYPADGPSFIGAELLATEKTGYTRTFHSGPPAPVSAGDAGVSPSSLLSFAYVAVPTEPKQSGIRGFCGDDTGLICVTQDGSGFQIDEGRCPTDCVPLN